MKKLQLEDLSKQLGYSKTLISMVLNGKGNQYGISKKTQELVLNEVTKLNYTPNKFAKSLRTGKSYFIGLIISDISNPFYASLAKHLEATLFEQGYNLLIGNTGENQDREKALVEMMVHHQGVDGLIISTAFENPAYYEHPQYQNTPMVFIDRVIPFYKCNHVVADNFGGANALVKSLIDKSCKKIACFTVTPSYLSTIEDRVRGYKKALLDADINVDLSLIKEINFENRDLDIKRELGNFLYQHTIPDAIFALNNHIASSLLKLLKQDAFKRFHNTKIACFDDVDLFNIIDKQINSVEQPVKEMAEKAGRMLIELISGTPISDSNITLPTKLILRQKANRITQPLPVG